jgi:lysophospholipase L1-like esterase
VFVGYPESIASEEHLLTSKKEVNASCPGETSDSFVNPGARDFGCHSAGPQGQPPFKAFVGLHADYPVTQLQFAVDQLTANKHIELVTLGIGSNDVFLLQRDCQSNPNPVACFNTGFPLLLENYANNLIKILTAIRSQAGYTGRLVLLGYYSPSAELIPVAIALNTVTAVIGARFGTIYADGFTAFQLAAIDFGGNVCNAGLLIHLDATTCDIHPSPKGRDLLAATVLASIGDRH